MKCTANKPPWIDIEYRKNRALRRKYEKQWRRKGTEVCKEMYVNQKQICIDMALAKQTEHYSKVVTDAGSCQKSLFKIANTLLDKTKVKVLPTYTDPKQLANQFNKFYIEKVKRIRNSIPSSVENPVYSRPFQGEPMNKFRIVTEEEIRKMF